MTDIAKMDDSLDSSGGTLPSLAVPATGGLADVQRLNRAGRFEEALDLGRRVVGRAFGLADDGLPRDPQLVADAATLLVRVTRRLERYDEALRWSNTALTAALTCGDASRECVARAQHARVLSVLNETAEAFEESYAALRAAARSGDARDEAVGLEALADAQWSLCQWDEALASYRRMLEVAVAAGDLELQGIAHGGIGGINHHLGEGQADDASPQALLHFRVAAAEAEAYLQCQVTLGDVYGMRTATNNHAIALLALGDTVAARASLESLLLAFGDTDSAARGLVLKNIADIDVIEGKLETAIARGREALETNDRLGDRHQSMACCGMLADACERTGDLAAALAYHRRLHALYVEVASASSQARARAMAVKYDTDMAHAVAMAQRARADRLESSHSTLSVEAERLVRLSLEDPLTGIGNRRRFDQTLVTADAAGAPARFSLALIDIDHFKRVNDEHSHQVGDEVLRRIGAILAANSRRDDVAARYGGEEFGLVLSGLEPRAARHACERVRQAVEAEDWGAVAAGLRVTVSVGVAHQSARSVRLAVPRLLALADRRLYAAKRAGRNRVVDQGSELADDEVVEYAPDTLGRPSFWSTGT